MASDDAAAAATERLQTNNRENARCTRFIDPPLFDVGAAQQCVRIHEPHPLGATKIKELIVRTEL
jgi:hypothetical protein